MKPRIEDNDSMNGDLYKLQVLQNDMVRMLCKKKRSDKIRMDDLRQSMGIMSFNQMAVYHILIEAYNVIHFKSVEKIRKKLVREQKEEGKLLRSRTKGHLVTIKRPKKESCVGFTYFASKLWNKLPVEIRSSKSPDIFKKRVKTWIWNKNVPS